MGVSSIFLRCGVLALVLGVGLGMWMGGTGAYQFQPAHAHANLAGWASMMLFGFFYRLFPDAGDNWPARLHATLSISGLVFFLGGMIAVEAGADSGLVVKIAGELLFSLGVLVFVFILFDATRRKSG